MTPAPDPPRSVAEEYAWVIPVLVGAVALTLLIILEPAWGANAAAALSFLVGVLAIVVSVLIDRGYFRRFRRAGAFRLWQRRTVAASTSMVMVFGLIWWVVKREQDPFDYLSGKVLIGYTDANYPAWHTRPANTPDADYGFDVALVAALEKKFYRADFEWIPVSGLQGREDALIPGRPGPKAKLVISNFSITPQRQEVIDFAGPYFVDVQGLLSRTGNRVPDARDNVLCGLDGSTGSHTINKLGWRLKGKETIEQCFTAYAGHELAGVSTDMSIVQTYRQGRSRQRLPGTVVDLQAIGTEEYGIGIPNNRPRLCRALNEAIEDFLADSWDGAFRAFLAPDGVSRANRKPLHTDECEPAGPMSFKR